MSLATGMKLGHYEIVAPLGTGGMGEVYRARDTKLNRDVAIKVLPELFANDAERLARFTREAQTLASLNHPHVAQIHGLEELSPPAGSGLAVFHALVMELVEGEDLSHKIRSADSGRSPRGLLLEEALLIAKQIAEALEAAHHHGIIHRDLKPSNIRVREDGTVKVLDFGLAKALVGSDTAARAGIADGAAEANSPTQSLHATQAGIILGTAAYMSPEQARGKTVDTRTDIWALGCVLFEMLSGSRAFPGADATDTIVAVVSKDPDWNRLPSAVPAGIRRLLKRSLEKDPKRRLDSAVAVRLEIDDAVAAPPVDATAARHAPRVNRWTSWLPWAIATGLAVTLMVVSNQSRPAPASTASVPPPVHMLLSQQVPASTAAGQPSLAIAPDGTRVVYLANSTGTPQLYLRDLNSVEPRPIAGTEGAINPFFSPDGQRIGFFARDKLQVTALAGGAPVSLTDVPSAGGTRGAVWTDDDTVIYSPATDAGLWSVPAAGGTPHLLAQPDSAKGERSYRWPALLPGGETVMFTIAMSDILSFDDARLVVRSLRTGEQREVVRGGSFGAYAATGHLLYARAGALIAVPFNAQQLAMTGTPRPVLDGLVTYPISGAAQYALSQNGTLLYVAGTSESRQATLSWVTRTGQSSPLAVPPAAYQNVSVSPDGRRAALNIDGANANVWILDFDRTAMTRLTLEWSNNGTIWTPDGARVAFTSARSGIRSLFWQRVDNQGGQEPVFPLDQSPGTVTEASWLPDGQTVIFDALSPRTGRDLWVASTAGERAPKPLLQTSFDEGTPRVSPDGRWLAYLSNETGRQEVYVQPYPGPGEKLRVSGDGGSRLEWARDARELFYRSRSAMMGAVVNPSGSPEKPRLLFETRSTSQFGVGRDGRFLMIENLPSPTAARPVTVVLNWSEELKRLVPTR